MTVYKPESKKDGLITKVYESSPVENVSKFEDELCLELPEKVSVSGDTLICFYNKPKMKLGGKVKTSSFPGITSWQHTSNYYNIEFIVGSYSSI